MVLYFEMHDEIQDVSERKKVGENDSQDSTILDES